MWQEVVNDDYKNEKEAKRKNNSKPYRQISVNQDIDYPIHYFTVNEMSSSSNDKTYYSSNRNLVRQEINRILADLYEDYKNKGGYKEINQEGRILAWNFFSSKGFYGVPATVAVVVTTIWEAQERSPSLLSEVMEKDGLNHFNPK